MKKTILTFALLLGATVAVKAQTGDKSLLIDEVGQQYEISDAVISYDEDLHLNSQGKVTRANGDIVGYATKIGPIISGSAQMETEPIDDLIKNLGGASNLKKMAGL